MARTELLQGTLDMLILRTLYLGPQHGFGIAQHIQRVSHEVLTVEEGSLYPALYRMEEKSWIAAAWGQSENNRRAKYYRLTRAGRKQLEQETTDWKRMCVAIGRVFQAA